MENKFLQEFLNNSELVLKVAVRETNPIQKALY
jgi:hypothetical protein